MALLSELPLAAGNLSSSNSVRGSIALFGDKIPIAYHNGSELGLLSDDDIPKADGDPISLLNAIKDLLTEQPLLLEHCSIESTRSQLTVAPYSSFWGLFRNSGSSYVP